MEQAVALANNDVVLLAWSYDTKVADCLGFAIYRVDDQEQRTPLPAWIGFQGEDNPDWDPSTTERWPVQKFSWRDLTAARGEAYTYEIVPLTGAPGNLSPLTDRALKTNQVTLTPIRSNNVRAYFNRGILSTQALAHKLPHDSSGGPSHQVLLDHIRTAGDEIRMSLAGQIIEALSLLPGRAQDEGGSCRAALYELNDDELIGLLDDPDHVSLVLSNAGSYDDPDATNHDARQKLHDDHVDVTDRMLGSGHIGHDKFVVYVDSDGTPQAIQSGSTNWTSTGLCAQANNAILLFDAELAASYQDFSNRLQAECPADPAEHATQSEALRTKNRELSEHSIAQPLTIDQADVTLCLSPNTPQQRKPPGDDPPRPTDMGELFKLIEGANQGILFLLFQPGQPSVLDAILEAEVAKPELFVRGAATDRKAIEQYDTMLYHRTGDRAEVAAAAELDHAFGYWQKELLKSSPTAHAVIHDKILVIDPTSDDCVVVTGSHNLGYTASYANDENLLIVKGHRSLAEAYATHVMDIYDHYRWRWRQKHPDHSHPHDVGDCDGGSFGLITEDCWQTKYFEDPEAIAERLFWLPSKSPN